MLGNLKIGADLPQMIDLLEILERNISRLRRDLVKYEKTGEKPKTMRRGYKEDLSDYELPEKA